MRRTGIGLVVLAAVWTGVAGCGGGRNHSDAERAAQEYVNAYNARDFERLCGLLSDAYKADLLAGEGEGVEKVRCPEWFEEHTSGAATTLSLVGIEEDGNQASAHVRSKSEDSPGAENDLIVRVMRQPTGAWQVVDVTSG